MNVSLTKELERLIQQKVKSGRYHSASEVVREGLRLLEERDRLREARLKALRNGIRVGVDELDRGLGVDGEQVLRELESGLSRRKK